ncbi:MAG: ABC transporter permease [Desulfurococcales archaeon]|nr:ABC transporter permease [Desulfurococcales archaeon]
MKGEYDMGSIHRIISEPYYTLKSILRYKGTLFWVVIFPIMFYLLMIAIFGHASYSTVSVGIVVRDDGLVLTNGTKLNLGRILVQSMNESKLFTVKEYSNESNLRDDVIHGKIDIGLIVPFGFTSNITSMKSSSVKIIALKTQWGDYYEGVTKGFLQGFSDSIRDRYIDMGLNYSLRYIPSNYTPYIIAYYSFLKQPLNVSVERHAPPLLATDEGIRAYYAIGVIGIEILFIGLSYGVNSIIEMKREGTLKILLSAPIRNWEILATGTLSSLTAVGISAVSIYIISLLTGAQYNMDLITALATILLLLVGTIFTIGLGLLLAPLAKSPEAAMAITNGIAFPIMFIGGLAIPAFVLPRTLQKFAETYPLSLTIEAIRGMTTYSRTPIWALEKSLPAIIATVIVYLLGVIVVNKLLTMAVEE